MIGNIIRFAAVGAAALSLAVSDASAETLGIYQATLAESNQSLGPDALVQVRSWLDERLPRGSSGGISYEGYANAVKGYVPGG